MMPIVNEVIRIKVADMPTTSAIIAESHTLMRRALVALLREARPGWHSEDVEGIDELRERLGAHRALVEAVEPGLIDACRVIFEGDDARDFRTHVCDASYRHRDCDDHGRW